VVDASVFPTLTSVNPVVTVMLVADWAADLILRRAG
jgi:choline dehydrogenase-like flavoprotein